MRRHLFLLKIATLNTFKKRLRASLAIGSIAFSAGIMIVFFGIGDGLQSLVVGQVTNSDLRDVITVQPRDAQQVPLNQVTLSKLKSISGVTVVEQSVAIVGKISYHGISLDTPLYGVGESYFDLVTVSSKKGNLHKTLASESQNLVISSAALKAFGISPDEAVGKELKVGVQVPYSLASKQVESEQDFDLRTYKIVAVVDKDTSSAVYIPIAGLTSIGVDSASEVKMRVGSVEKVPTVRDSVSRLGFQTTSILDSIDQVNKVFGFIQRLLLFFGIASLVVTVFGTFNTITLTLIEETPQIGFLRLMGMHKRDVRFMFVAQSIMLTSVGSILGVLAGLLAGGLLNGLVRSLVTDSTLGDSIYIFQIPLTQTIIILMLSIILGWLVGIMPAKRAVTINPLEALRS
jgi:ABC-type antimicrobial peptide transport system permease subunit